MGFFAHLKIGTEFWSCPRALDDENPVHLLSFSALLVRSAIAPGSGTPSDLTLR